MYTVRKTYKDFDGNERTEDFRFHLSQPEVLEIETHTQGGIEELIKRIVSAQDAGQMVDVFKDLMKMSYGIKDPDGRGFRKSDSIWEDFKSTNAYSDIYMDLITDDQKASDFINGILPEDITVDEDDPELKAKMDELKVLAGGMGK